MNDGVIYCGIVVGMVFIDYVINDMGRFFIGFVLVIV